MKAVKIKVPVNLDTEQTVAIGSVVLVSEALKGILAQKAGNIPCQFSLSLFISKEAYNRGAKPITGVIDFPGLINTTITVSDYEALKEETLNTNTVFNYLVPIFGAENLDIINVTPKSV